MIKRFTFMKSILMFAVIFLTAFTLVACGDDNQALVDEALDAVSLVYASGDSATSVTQNLTLPTTVGDVQIAWASDQPTVITTAGVVTRQTADTNVVLTATLTLGDATAEKDFTVKVLAAVVVVVIDPVEALDAIALTGDLVGYDAITGRYNTKSDILLPTVSMTLTVSWESSNAALITTAGVVTRPAYGQVDSLVILTATIGTETKEFYVTVYAITEKPAELILSEASDALLLPGVSDGVSANLTLPTTVGTEGVTVTWTSSNTDLVTDAGVVTRPLDGNANVTLTATLHLGDQTVTKDFAVVVLTFEPFTAVADIAAALALTDGSYVEIPDLTVVGTFSTGFMVYDGTTILQVYKAPTEDVVDGAVFTIRGIITNYFGSMELTGSANMPIVLIDSVATAEVLSPTVLTGSVSDYIATLPAYPLVGALAYQYVQITAQVQVDDPLANYETFLVNTDFAGTNIDSSGAGSFITNALMVYYPSNINAVRSYAGMDVILNVFLFAQRSNNKIYTVIFTGTEDDISLVPLTDTELVNLAKTSVQSTFKSEYVLPQTITLPTEFAGVAVTWASDNVLFDATTGVLTMPLTGQEDVVVTATLSKGDVTGEQVVSFKAGEKPVQTVAEALLVEAGELVHVVGVVTASQYYRTFFVQDATGGIAIYTSNADFIAFLTANYGKEVDLVGTRAAYNGLNQISNVVINTLVGDATMPTAVNVDAAGLDSITIAPYQGQLVELTGLAVTAVNTDSYGNVTIKLYDANSDNEVTMKWDSRVTLSTEAAALLATIAVNDVIDVVNPLAWNNGPYLYFTDSTVITQVVLTDAERVALAKAVVMAFFADEYNEETTLSLPTSLFGVTIAYDTASTYFNVTTGAVTLPTIGRETVTVNATLTLGTETDSAVLEFIVGVQLISVLYTTADATIVTVQGVVVAGEYYNTFFIQDSSGAVAIYTSDATFSAALIVGNLVEVTGELDFYSALVEVKPSAVTVLATAQTLPAVLDIESYNLVGLINMQSQNVSLMELVVTKVDVDSYGNITLTLLDVSSDVSVQMKWDSRQVLSTEAQAQIDAIALGDVIDLTTTLGWKNAPYLFYTDTSIITVVASPSAAALLAVDQAFADTDADALSVVATALEATTLTLPVAGTNGTTIAWTSSDDAIINPTTGAVVLPVSGQVVVTLTATVTLNAAETVVTFDVAVGVAEVIPFVVRDLFISEYIEGSSSNKAIEIYNPTDGTVDLTLYTLELYSNGSATATSTYDLTGTLASGAVFILANSSANQTILDLADDALAYPSVPNWNGDDAVTLSKDGVVIDMFGV
ncbi:MAG: lamin tail domain-containing protein, partial [Firmicutes bacterium]|nr:lamin tail domain-containing protein [Bacillota bacterium]